MSWLASLAIGTIVVLGMACGEPASEPVALQAGGGTRLAVAVKPEAPRVGANVLSIELRDASGAPVTGAEVAARIVMHAMGAMPAMGGPVPVSEEAPGRYRADFELAMGGTWQVELEATPPGGSATRVEGSLTVGTPGLRLEGAEAGAAAMPPDAATPPHDHSGAATPPHDPSDTEAHPGEFRFPSGRLQRVGVKIAPAERRALHTTIRAAGRVIAEETTLEDVSLKVRGWVGRILVDAVGDPVEAGAVLFTVYSPELYAAQQEYVQALRSQERARESSSPDRADYLVRAARNRLHLWDVADSEIDRIGRAGEPMQHVPIRAGVSGYVVEKNLVEGSAFQPGERLYRIAPLGQVWVEAEVYEYELPLVEEGQAATVTMPYVSDRSFEARIDYVYPTLDPKTRTARLRLVIPNAELALRPDMYANVEVHVERGERLVVPQSAVLHAGERSFVFRSLGEGRFRPQKVRVGLRSGDDVEIIEGLEAGDPIVTSATFLIASESRLRAALEQW